MVGLLPMRSKRCRRHVVLDGPERGPEGFVSALPLATEAIDAKEFVCLRGIVSTMRTNKIVMEEGKRLQPPKFTNSCPLDVLQSLLCTNPVIRPACKPKAEIVVEKLCDSVNPFDLESCAWQAYLARFR